MPRLRSYGHSDIGRRREINEDALRCDDGLGLYLVADGVGGHAKGEIASSEAVDNIYDFVARERAALERDLNQPSTAERREEVRRLLESAVQSACYLVFGMAEMDPSQKGMSTTMSALLVSGGFAVTAQVGDSRIYRVRGGRGVQLTEDHTLLNYKIKKGEITADQARTMRGKNVITRAVGHKDYVEVDTRLVDVIPGDRYLLCSDGLHGYLDEGELEKVLAEGELSAAPLRFIELANARGGKDNVTVIVVCVDEE
jgi:serine/threonine protein phosphatase PrpC